MGIKRNAIIKQAQSWIGCRMSDGSHRKIIDAYNAHKPLARGYAVKYTDAWCATFVSAVAIKCGATNIIPTECGCSAMINLFKGLGRWVEKDSYNPKPGDIIFYDWSDNGRGDNVSAPDHVGIVESCDGVRIVVIEGNMSSQSYVGRRVIMVDGKFIRGFGIPKYDNDSVSVDKPVKTPTASEIKDKVKSWQHAMNIGFDFKNSSGKTLKSGALVEDGLFGEKSTAFAKSHNLYYGIQGCPTAVKWVQSIVGVVPDGRFGTNTKNAVMVYQRDHGLVVDGIVGYNTYRSMLSL